MLQVFLFLLIFVMHVGRYAIVMHTGMPINYSYITFSKFLMKYAHKAMGKKISNIMQALLFYFLNLDFKSLPKIDYYLLILEELRLCQYVPKLLFLFFFPFWANSGLTKCHNQLNKLQLNQQLR